MNYFLIILTILTLNNYSTKDLSIEAELDCLVKNIYFEARGETENGQIAVAYVTLNRVRSSKYPNSICGVVKDPAQFSWFWDNKSDLMKNEKAKKKAYVIATDILLGKYKDSTKNALFYHNTSIIPNWTKNLAKVVKIDNHIFYKEKI
jgi:spore germination cell wall hydrolase CwlJ-like protein